MKRLIALAIICSGFIAVDGFAARTAVRRPAGATGGTTQAVTTAQPATTTAARAAVTRGRTPSSGAVKANVAGAQKQTAAAPKQTAAASAPKKINARAATTQKVINSGTKVAGATANTVVSEECRTKFYGCMDSFCMLDNTNGGRCLCSNRHSELEKVLEDIQKLDEQSYAMATTGVERINMGESAEAVEAMVKNITDSIKTSDESDTKAKSKGRSLNLDAWNIIDIDEDELFGAFNDSNIENQTGDALRSSVTDLCVKQMPECSSELNMLKMMYNQQIKSDCTAYENSLKQQKNASAKKLQTAQQALRETALEQHQNANKYDLGQCTIRFKQCMQTTAGCGEDFANCASIVATDNAQTKVGGKNKKQNTKDYSIKGAVSSITIAASTYDTLLAKKPMCESVTKQCVAVKDKVWDTFMREAALELKSAELIAESNIRMNCIGNISQCFQKACKDTMDPNDPDGSYDMCLSRPETMRSFCKVQIDPCEATEPKIMDYVTARLASMRVDACTNEIKECLTDDNRCGSDYANCVGLDTSVIVDMCPVEKLTACNVDPKTGEAYTQANVYEKIANVITGILLNIDNSLLAQCQKAADESMIKVCGDTAVCDTVEFDISTVKSLMNVQLCNNYGTGSECYSAVPNVDDLKALNLKAVLKNVPEVSLITFSEKDMKFEIVSDFERLTSTESITISRDNGSSVNKANASSAIREVTPSLQKVVDILNATLTRTINMLQSDTKVDYCIKGRAVRGVVEADKSYGRFTNLMDKYKGIVASGMLSKLSLEHAKLMSEFNEKIAELDSEVTERIHENDEAKKDETNKKNCEEMVAQTLTGWPRGKDPNDWRNGCPTDYAAEKKFWHCKNDCESSMISPAGISQLVNKEATYNPGTNECTIVTTQYSCIDWKNTLWCKLHCEKYDEGKVTDTQVIKM